MQSDDSMAFFQARSGICLSLASAVAWPPAGISIRLREQHMKIAALGVLALAASGFAASAFAGEEVVTAAIPEPAMLGLLAVGIAAAVAIRLRGRK
jgi:hypothetical protein